MYEFVLLQFKMRHVNEEQVRALAPQYITEAQAEKIISVMSQ